MTMNVIGDSLKNRYKSRLKIRIESTKNGIMNCTESNIAIKNLLDVLSASIDDFMFILMIPVIYRLLNVKIKYKKKYIIKHCYVSSKLANLRSLNVPI